MRAWPGKAGSKLAVERHPAVLVRDVTRCFGRRRALDGLCLSLQPREWVGLLGPNGAGKTTLLKCIAGLLAIDAGEIRLFGRHAGRSGRRSDGRAIGYVPQEIGLYTHLTARENLSVFGELHGMSRGELRQRVEWAVEWTALSGRSDDLVGSYSVGMQRRLNIACAVLHRPRLVLLDEPTVGVDPQGRERIWRMLAQLRAEGATLVQSTHELHEIESVCNRMLIMDAGRIIAAGTVDQLVAGILGRGTRLELIFDAEGDVTLPAGTEAVAGNRVRGWLTDVTAELPPLLEHFRQAGVRVRHMHVERPGLAAVFTRLTGRELRE